MRTPSATIIASGGVQFIEAGGTAASTTIGSGGKQTIMVGGNASVITISRGGNQSVAGVASGTVNSGGIDFVGGTTVSAIVKSGGLELAGSFQDVYGSANGIVDVLSGGSADVAFLSNGSGGLEIEDSANNASAFTGKVSGFGGPGHANHKQFIDLVSVTSAVRTDPPQLRLRGLPHQRHAVRLERRHGGGGDQHHRRLYVGELQRQGRQQRQCGDRRSGGAQWRQRRKPSRGKASICPNIAFGAQTTLAYAANANGTGGTLTVSDGRHAASIALLGTYMAGTFVTAADGHGGTLLTEASQLAQAPLLAQPRPG